MTILMSLKSNVQIRKNTYIISYQNERAAAWCFKLVQDPNQDAVEQKNSLVTSLSAGKLHRMSLFVRFGIAGQPCNEGYTETDTINRDLPCQER